MAVPMTYCSQVKVKGFPWEENNTYLCDICRDDGGLCEEIKDIVEPWWEVGLAVLGKVHSRHGAQLDA